MHKFGRIALAISLAVCSVQLVNAFENTKSDAIPVLEPESQHIASSKRITAQFTRAHFKKLILTMNYLVRYLIVTSNNLITIAMFFSIRH